MKAKSKYISENLERDGTGKFLNPAKEDDLKDSMSRPLTDKEKQLIENFKRRKDGKDKTENNVDKD